MGSDQVSDDPTAQLHRRLGALEDIEAIRRLKAAYCAACDDDHNGDTVAALFVPDGTWSQTGRTPSEGREAIAARMFDIRDAGFVKRSAHMVTNPVIDVTGDTATGSWRFLMIYTGPDEASYFRIIGTYSDRYERRDGTWYFRSLSAHIEERGQYQAATTEGIAR